MDRRSLRPLILLAAMTGWTGCNHSTGEQSYEIVETPKPAGHEAQKPVADEAPLRDQPVTDTTKLNSLPGTLAEPKPQEVERVATQTPPSPAAIQIAAVTEKVAARGTGLPGLEPLTPSADSLKSLPPNKIELKVPHRDFVRERDKALRVSYDDLDLLKVLNMEPVPLNAEDYLPDWLKQLNGQKVRLKGWMFPPLMTEGLPAFLFVRDNQICCFGREAKVYDKVRVTLKEGTTTDYIFGRPFDVAGTFHIESEERDGQLYFLYSIDDAVVTK
ncbi:MAG TPA: hypothetical protein VM510_17885 [Caulifigura sp.]|nr:hypothetical protein [Caulifigura sp.]